MRRARWSARPHSGAARIAVPLALALVVGLILGLKLIGSGGHGLSLSAAGGACPSASTTTSTTPSTTTSTTPSTTTPSTAASTSPATNVPAAAAVPSTAAPSTAASTSAAGTTSAVSASKLVVRTPVHRRHWWDPPTPTVSAVATTAAPTTAAPSVSASSTVCPTATATATAPAAVANVSCDIIVPANPLSAVGLSTPYQLTGAGGMTPAASGCTTTNSANLGAFVQATILDPATGALSVYEPLVITQGTTPAEPPVVPTLPAGAIVTIDVGFNGTNLTQVGATPAALRQGNCVDGLNGSIFGQVSFCNGQQFFAAAARAEAAGLLTVPAAGVSSKTGAACPTVRNFDMIDQDQSDNVTTTYLLTAGGQTAQFNPANVAALPGAMDLVNGSDNKLLSAFLDPTLGCTEFEAPDLSMGGAMNSSQALNELSAAATGATPIALVPENDEMTLVNNAFSAQKTNLYRSEVGQAPISGANNAADSPALYCQNMVNIQTPFLNTNQALLATGTSPVPAVGNNLFTFMANRLSMSFTNLNCQNFGLTDPVTVTLDGNGVATAATFNVTQQTATNTGTTTMPAPGQRVGRGGGRGHGGGNPHHRLMDPSGM
jgi:hypothetical protein